MLIGGPTVSGLDDHDYPSLHGSSISLTNINQMKIHSKIPLPSEVMEHFGRILVIFYVYHVYVLFDSSLIFLSNSYYFLNVFFFRYAMSLHDGFIYRYFKSMAYN